MKTIGFLLAVLVSIAGAQQGTRVSLVKQSRNVDFSDFPSAKVFPVGNTFPSTCQVSEMFYRTDMAPGANLFACTSSNTWTQIGSAGSGLDPGFQVVRTGNNVLSIGNNCSSGLPCLARTGSVVRSFSQPAVLTLGTGTGSVFIYINSVGILSVASTPSATVQMSCSGCMLEAQLTDFPADSLPLYQWNSTTNGVWDATGFDRRTVLSTGRLLVAGNNISLAQTGTSVTISSTNFLPTGAVVNNSSFALNGPIPASDTRPLLGLGGNLTGGAAGGTALGIHTPAGYTGQFAQWMHDGSRRFSWDLNGGFSAEREGAMVEWMGNGASGVDSSFRLAVAGTAASNQLQLGTGTSGNFLIGDGRGKVSIGTAAAAPEDADLLVSDARPTTGSTQVQIRGGAGQDRDLLSLRNAQNQTLLAVDLNGGLRLSPVGTRPACDSATRGLLWYAQGAATEADAVQVCMKMANESYSWKNLSIQ